MLQSGLTFRILRASNAVYNHKAFLSTSPGAIHHDEVQPFSKIPAIPRLPFIGSGWVYYPFIGKYDFTRMHLASVKKLEEYGPIYRESFSSDYEVVSLFNPEDIKKMYRSDGPFPSRKVLETLLRYRKDKKDLYHNGGLLTTQGEEWWEVRKQVQPHMMKPKEIYSYLGAMDQVAKDFTDRMDHLRGKDGGEIPNYLDELNKWSFESVGLVALDTRLGCVDLNPNKEAVKMINTITTLFYQIMRLEFGSINLWQKYPTYAYRRFEKNMDFFSREVFKYLQEAKRKLAAKGEDEEVTFLEKLISTTEDPRNVNATIVDTMLAGVDTTSSTVGFVLYNLARHPDVQEKLYEEIRSTVKNRSLTKEMLNNLHYLKACVKESMRLYPAAFATLRTLSEDTVLSGYAVPAGTYMLGQLYAIGRMDKHFPEANKYRPERFLKDGKEHNPFGFLPFGFGNRSCIGRRIAEQEMWTVLTRVIERFRVEYNYEDVGMLVRLVTTPDKPLRFQFFDR